MNKSTLEKPYFHFLANLKSRLASGQYKAVLGVNHELILLYHNIGIEILKSQEIHGWGAKVIDHLSHDLKSEFPEMKGFSLRNLKYMRKFAEEYPNRKFVQQVVAQIPWGHNIFLMELVPIKQERLFYIKKTIEHGWSRNIMAMQIEIALHKRQEQSIINFKNIELPTNHLNITPSMRKDPFIYDFLNMEKIANELESLKV